MWQFRQKIGITASTPTYFTNARALKVKTQTTFITDVVKGKHPSKMDAQPEEPQEAQASNIVVEKFEVEIKSGIKLEDGKNVKLFQPDIDKLTSEGLSVVRLSLRSIPVLKIIEKETKSICKTESETPSNKERKRELKCACQSITIES